MARTLAKKTKWTLAILLCVLAAGAALLISSSCHPGAFVVGFAGYTNYQGDRVAIFDLTNRYRFPVDFIVAVERKTAAGWPVYAPGTALPHTAPTAVGQEPKLKTGETYRLLIILPTGEDFSAWRISVGGFRARREGMFDSTLWRVSVAAGNVGMTRISEALNPGPKGFIVYGPEITR